MAFEHFCSSRFPSPEAPPPRFKQKVKLDDLMLSSVNIRSIVHWFFWVYSITLFLVAVNVTLLKFRCPRFKSSRCIFETTEKNSHLWLLICCSSY